MQGRSTRLCVPPREKAQTAPPRRAGEAGALGGAGSWGQGRERERGLGEGRMMVRVGGIKRVRWQLAMGCRDGRL